MSDPLIDARGGTRFTYVATIAICMSAAFPDPDACASLAGGPNQLAVTNLDMLSGMPWSAYLRFDLDASVVGKTAVGLTLEMTAANSPDAASDNSGVVWQTKPFTLTSIMTGMVPMKTGASAVAGSQGAVAKLQVVDWPLSPALVAATLCLEVDSPSADGVNYWNTLGVNPPRLLVDVN